MENYEVRVIDVETTYLNGSLGKVVFLLVVVFIQSSNNFTTSSGIENKHTLFF